MVGALRIKTLQTGSQLLRIKAYPRLQGNLSKFCLGGQVLSVLVMRMRAGKVEVGKMKQVRMTILVSNALKLAIR